MPVPSSAPKLARALARDEVYATLHEWIMDGTLQSGEQLRDHELAAALGVSRTPVREALRRLEDAGLVQTAANRWTRVAPVDAGDAERIYPILWLLEPLAIDLSQGRLGTAELAVLDAANAHIRAAIAGGEAAAAAAGDYQFHRALSAHCGNPELIRIVGDLRAKLRRMAAAYFNDRASAEQSLREHEAIVDALRRGDYPRAGGASEAHWQGSLCRFRAHTGVSGPDGQA